jgi:DNA topoisomerase-1
LHACEQEKQGTTSSAAMLDWVSGKLGNTRNVCKKYYVHPLLISFCDEKKQLDDLKPSSSAKSGFTKSEQLLMAVLKKA